MASYSLLVRSLLAVVLLVLGLTPVSASNAFSFQISRYSNECFFELLKRNDRLDLSFEVMHSSGSDYDIDYTISNPDGSLLHSFPQERQGNLGFNAIHEGSYQICFSNMRYNSEKMIVFSITGPDEHKIIRDMKKDNTKEIDEEQMDLFRTLQILMDNIRFMRDEQSFLLKRQNRHRESK
ncbi:hypothetical protein BDV3_003645 [Batrachochytrium dendrobatidis]|nr:Transmembrane emp24 domain-containing protein 2 [Batrachochytrium dendrobatidis]KAK5669532.1 Transmembrane emp24 domain-containing protein 2 [Batrachochytrium dendrobatidis]